MYSGLVCHSCCTQIQDYVNKNYNGSKFYCLINSAKSIITRKEMETVISGFLKPDLFIYGLDLNNEDSLELKKLYKSYSPSLIVFLNGEPVFLPYKKIFSAEGKLIDIKKILGKIE